MTKISDERLAEMLDGLQKLEHGPWFHGVADGRNGVAGLAQVDNGAEMWPVIAEWPEAAHIANCDPDTIRSIITELQQLRAHNSDSAEPVAWRYRCVIEGGEIEHWSRWIVLPHDPAAELAGSIHEIQPLYLAPPAVITEGMVRKVALRIGFNLGFNPREPFIEHIKMARAALEEALTNRTPDDEVGNG